MKKNLIITTSFLLLSSIGFSQKKATVSNDFISAMQGDWKGKLTYTDYQNDSTQVTMDVWLKSSFEDAKLVKEFYYREPDGKTKQKAKSTDTTYIADNGEKLFETGYKNPFKIRTYENINETKKLIMETKDEDNNKASTIKTTITLTPSSMTIKKEVKYNGTSNFFVRHTFSYTK
jgi:hypothetical protein